MVVSNAYLLLGPDAQTKEAHLKTVTKEFLSDKFKDFNVDNLFADELTPGGLSESLGCLPTKSSKRLIVIRNIERFSPKNRQIILAFLRKPHPWVAIVLETSLGFVSGKKKLEEKYQFLQSLRGLCNIYDTSQPLINTFSLARLIDGRRTQEALRILAKLFQQGEKPERILGGLRFHWSQEDINLKEHRARLKLLLEADRYIKTTSLKDNLVLELMVVKLCRL